MRIRAPLLVFTALLLGLPGAARAVDITEGLATPNFTESQASPASYTGSKVADNVANVSSSWNIDAPSYLATAASPHWVRMRFFGGATASGINILSYNNGQGARLKDFRVQGSADGTTWAFSSPLFTYANSQTFQAFSWSPPASPYGYWRVAVESTYDYAVANGRYNISELELEGTYSAPVDLTNGLLSGAFTASQSDPAAYGPQRVADENDTAASSWNIDSAGYLASVGNPHWVKIDLGVARAVDNLNIRSYNNGQGARLRDFAVQGSNDGVVWDFSSPTFTYASATTAAWQPFSWTAPAAEYRYWRIAIYSTWDMFTATGRYNISELELFGLGQASAVPEPASLALLGAGVAAGAAARRRRCRSLT